MSKRILGVLEYGVQDGFPFNRCFDGIKRIRSLEDFDAKELSAVVFWGGTDISPSLYQEKANSFSEARNEPSRRDLFEWTLMKYCTGEAIPMIGVCRGAQLLCAFAGGKLAQHVTGHNASHEITTNEGEIFKPRADHHQMMLPGLPGEVEHELLAWSTHPRSDYYIGQGETITYFPAGFKEPEIVWFPGIRGLAIQPHPEWMDECAFNDYVRELTRAYCLGKKSC